MCKPRLQTVLRAFVVTWFLATGLALAAEKPAPKPLYRDPVCDGAADPVVIWNPHVGTWWMFYTNRRANVPSLSGVAWVHGTRIGIAESTDGGVTWAYVGTAEIDLPAELAGTEPTYWAPEVVTAPDGTHHMFVTVVPGVFENWNHPRTIIHLTSTDLRYWADPKPLSLSSDRVIDACVLQLPNGSWRMWYNNERDRKSIYYADSPDLQTWTDRGKAVGDQGGEGPKVFAWHGSYWMVTDVWDGLAVYRSDDTLTWKRQPKNLLQEPGAGLDDQVKGGHPDVVVSGDRAFLFYFTHPGRRGPDARKDGAEQRRSSIQVVELYPDGQWLTCDRDKPTYIQLRPGVSAQRASWMPVGLSGGGGMFSPGISPVDPNLMMINCDMSAAYLSEDGGHNWRMISQGQLRSDTRCRPAFHPADPDIIYASSGGRLRVSRDRGKTFESIGNLRQSLFGEIAINPSDPKTMLVGTRDRKCHISRDAGVTWTQCAGPEGEVIGFHFDRTSRARIMFAATGDGIWRSDDGGRTWVEKADGLPWKPIRGFAGGSNTTGNVVMLYCTVDSRQEDGRLKGGVYRSADRGQSWQSVMGEGINVETTQTGQWAYGPIAQYRQVLTTDANPKTVYALNTSTGFHPPFHETVYRSDDGGRTWRATYFQDPRFDEYNLTPNYVSASTGQSYKGGGTPFGAAICNSDPERLVLVWSHSSLTHDGGKTWFTGDTYPAPGQTPGPGSAWVCTGLVVTTTWNYYIDPFESNRHYIAYTDIGMARSVDSGRTWIWWDKNSWAPWRNTCYEMVFDPDVPGKIWGAFSDVHDIPNDNIISERHGHDRPGGVCISRDFAASWKHEAQGIPPKPVTSIVLDPKSPRDARTLYAGVFMQGVYKSTDDGKTWTLKKHGLGDPKNMRISRVFLHADGTLFALVCAKRPGPGKPLMSEGVGLYRSRNGAESWTKVNASKLFLYPKDFSVHSQYSNIILVGTCDPSWDDQSGGLYRTDDGGTTWRRIGRQGRQTFGGYFHPKHEGWIYMTLTEGAPGAGLWLSQDDGENWEAFDGLPFSNVQRVTFDPADEAALIVTTFGGSVWRGPATPDDR